MAHVVIVSGSGRYADPWHPFAETSARIAEVLREAGHSVVIDEEVDDRLASLPDDDIDLLVLNLGAGRTPTERALVETSDVVAKPSTSQTDVATRAGLLASVRGGLPVLAFHVAATSFGFVPEWEQMLGGIWVRGTTMHPPYSRAHVEVTTDAHPITAGISDFDLDDERYTWLRVSPDAVQLAWHEHGQTRQPLLWAHESHGTRVVYDALGHDAASFDSAQHRRIVMQAVQWLLE